MNVGTSIALHRNKRGTRLSRRTKRRESEGLDVATTEMPMVVFEGYGPEPDIKVSAWRDAFARQDISIALLSILERRVGIELHGKMTTSKSPGNSASMHVMIAQSLALNRWTK